MPTVLENTPTLILQPSPTAEQLDAFQAKLTSHMSNILKQKPDLDLAYRQLDNTKNKILYEINQALILRGYLNLVAHDYQSFGTDSGFFNTTPHMQRLYHELTHSELHEFLLSSCFIAWGMRFAELPMCAEKYLLEMQLHHQLLYASKAMYSTAEWDEWMGETGYVAEALKLLTEEYVSQREEFVNAILPPPLEGMPVADKETEVVKAHKDYLTRCAQWLYSDEGRDGNDWLLETALISALTYRSKVINGAVTSEDYKVWKEAVDAALGLGEMDQVPSSEQGSSVEGQDGSKQSDEEEDDGVLVEAVEAPLKAVTYAAEKLALENQIQGDVLEAATEAAVGAIVEAATEDVAEAEK